MPEDQCPTRVLLLRHGETADNGAGVVQGQGGGPLSPLGREQAGAATARLGQERPLAIYASDLLRARETAAIVAAAFRGVPLHYDVRLREQMFGVYEGGSVRQLLRAMVKAGADFTSFDPEGGEPAGAFRARVAEVLGELAERCPGATVLLVTHHGFIRMTRSLYHPGRQSLTPQGGVGNGSLTLAEVGPGGILSLGEYLPEQGAGESK